MIFLTEGVGQDAHGSYGLTERLERGVTGSMPQLYGRVLAGLLQRAALIYELGVLQHQ